jgi:hypothetical protein
VAVLVIGKEKQLFLTLARSLRLAIVRSTRLSGEYIQQILNRLRAKLRGSLNDSSFDAFPSSVRPSEFGKI